MPISIDCPRCRSNLAVPTKLAGQYVFCPKCQGRLWVPRSSAASGPGSDPPSVSAPSDVVSGTAAAPSYALPLDVDPMAPVKPASAATAVAPPVVTEPSPPRTGRPDVAVFIPPSGVDPSLVAMPSAGVQPPSRTGAPPAVGRQPAQSVQPGASAPPHVAAPAPAPAASDARSPRRIAQFITADVAKSQLTLASDGKLPELHLNLEETAKKGIRPLSGGGQWRMLVLVCASLGVSLLIMIAPTGSNRRQSPAQDDARQRIESVYFGREGETLKPYQIDLRWAQQAHDRGDKSAERRYYLKVLNQLRDESFPSSGKSLTGLAECPTNDRTLGCDPDLKRQIEIILENE